MKGFINNSNSYDDYYFYYKYCETNNIELNDNYSYNDYLAEIGLRNKICKHI